MANFVNSGNTAIAYLRRELEDLFDDMELPRRMRREMDRLFAEAPSPMVLWREMDQLLDVFACPLSLKRHIEQVFVRTLSVVGNTFGQGRGYGYDSYTGEYYAPSRGIDSFNTFTRGGNEYSTPWRGIDSLNGWSSFTRGGNEFYTPWRGVDSFTRGGGEYFTPWRGIGNLGRTGGEYFTPWRGGESFSQIRNNSFSNLRNDSFFSPVRNDYFSPVRNDSFFSPMRGAERFWGRTTGGRTFEEFVPPVELIEREGEYLVRVELAGVREQDVEIRTNDHVLTIRGERRERLDNDGRYMNNYEYSERRYGVFSRTLTLPQGIDASHIHAVFRDGVLELRIPQLETFRQRRIPIGRDDARVINETNAGVHQRPHVS